MKQKITKVLSVVIAVVIVIGLVVMFTKGFEFQLKYKESQSLKVNLGKEFNNDDIKEICKEVFGNQSVNIQEIEIYKDTICVTTTEITEEQKDSFVKLINEKYELELKVENVEIQNKAHVRLRDMVKPYVISEIIITVIVLAYFMIRFYKLNIFNVLVKVLASVVVSGAILASVIAILWIPVGDYVFALGLVVYMLAVYVCANKLETELLKLKDEQKKK